MIWLLLVSFIWAFSFGLIKGHLVGIEPNFVAFVRMAVAFLVFLPFLRPGALTLRRATPFFLIGALQFGVMYVAYLYSYWFLDAYQVALYTIFTPIYVTLFNDLLDRRLRPLLLLPCLLAVAGAYVTQQGSLEGIEVRTGFLLLQLSNFSFAAGQVLYKRLRKREPGLKDRHLFALLYLGGIAVTGAAAALTTEWTALSLSAVQVSILLYLGVLASGLCFFLWNYGATRTSTANLAVLNNVKVPLAVACSLLFFGEEGNLPALLAGGALIAAALFLNPRLEGSGTR